MKKSPTFGPYAYDDAINEVLIHPLYFSLTKSEAYAIFGHTTIFSYKKVNLWLRNGTNQSQVNPIKNLINSALIKMPRVPANTNYYRGLPLSGNDLTLFIAQHQEDQIVTYNEFISAANNRADSFIDNPESNVKIIMETKSNSNGRTIHPLSFGRFKLNTTDEALFVTGSKFEVLSFQEPINGVFEIIMREID